MSFESCMSECPLIAILRGITPEEIPGVCDILYKNGLRLLEIPLNSPDALTSISLAVRHTAGRMHVGAGTVLTAEDVRNVREASPSPVEGLRIWCKTHGRPAQAALPGSSGSRREHGAPWFEFPRSRRPAAGRAPWVECAPACGRGSIPPRWD